MQAWGCVRMEWLREIAGGAAILAAFIVWAASMRVVGKARRAQIRAAQGGQPVAFRYDADKGRISSTRNDIWVEARGAKAGQRRFVLHWDKRRIGFRTRAEMDYTDELTPVWVVEAVDGPSTGAARTDVLALIQGALSVYTGGGQTAPELGAAYVRFANAAAPARRSA